MSLDKDDTFCSGSSSLTKLDDGLELAQISESQLSLGSSSLTKLVGQTHEMIEITL